MIPLSRLRALRRNPQYLSERQMAALVASIRRDGFLSPVLVRPVRGARDEYEIVSGNHRVLAAREAGLESVPCVVADLSATAAARAAVNLNTIHGDPNAELLAPFLAELPDDVLGTIHLEADLLASLRQFDATLKLRLDELEPPDVIDRDSPQTSIEVCACPTCGRKHLRGKA